MLNDTGDIISNPTTSAVSGVLRGGRQLTFTPKYDAFFFLKKNNNNVKEPVHSDDDNQIIIFIKL